MEQYNSAYLVKISVLERDEGKPVPDAKNSSVQASWSWEGVPSCMEVCIGEKFAGPVIGIETVACSEARVTFIALRTTAKRSLQEEKSSINIGKQL